MTGRLVFAWTLTAVCAGVAQASLLDIAFYSSNFPSATPSGAAVLGQAGDIWNHIDAGNPGVPTAYGPISLVDTTGTAIAPLLNYNAEGGVISVATNTQPLPALTNTYAFNNDGGSLTVTFTGLAPSQAYSLVLYLASDDASGGERSVAGTVSGLASVPFSATGNAQPTFIDGENEVQLSVSSDAGGMLAITASDGIGNSAGEVDLNGLQLQGPFPAASTVPEPTTVAFLIAGFALLLLGSHRTARR